MRRVLGILSLAVAAGTVIQRIIPNHQLDNTLVHVEVGKEL